MKGFCQITLGLLALTFLTGCSSEESMDYQTFSNLDSSQSDSQFSKPPVEIPLVAPKPESSVTDQAAGITELASGMLRPIRLQVPEKEFRTDPKTGEIILSFVDLDLFEVLNMEPVPPNAVDYFPEWLKELDGKQVQIRGFMVPPPYAEVESFLLARDNEACCMGPSTRIYHLMHVLMKDGQSVEFFPRYAYSLSGTFRIDPISTEGDWLGLFILEDAVRRK